MAMTLAQELDLVETAIQNALKAQSTTAGDGRQVVHANLEALYRQRDNLKLRIDWAANGRVKALEVP